MGAHRLPTATESSPRHRRLPYCRWIDDRDRAVSLLRSADNPKSGTMERVELIEDLDVRGFCTQGTVGAGGRIPTCTASFQPAVFHQTTRAGFI